MYIRIHAHSLRIKLICKNIENPLKLLQWCQPQRGGCIIFSNPCQRRRSSFCNQPAIVQLHSEPVCWNQLKSQNRKHQHLIKWKLQQKYVYHNTFRSSLELKIRVFCALTEILSNFCSDLITRSVFLVFSYCVRIIVEWSKHKKCLLCLREELKCSSFVCCSRFLRTTLLPFGVDFVFFVVCDFAINKFICNLNWFFFGMSFKQPH